MSLGIYPDIGLAKARELHQEARQKLADGLDPSALKQAAKARIANTFGELAADWLARQAVKDIRRAKLALWLERECASLADMPIDSVTARDILAVARAVEDSSADRARRIVGLCGQVMRFGVASGIAERDPSGDLKGALSKPPNGNFTATTDPANLATLMRADLGAQRPSADAGCAQVFSPDVHTARGTARRGATLAPATPTGTLTFTRPGELRGAVWTEIVGDSLTIPAARMKMGRDHIVPLSRQSIEILQSLPRTSVYALPMQTDDKRPMASNTVADAVRRMGFAHTAHGFRATARTILDQGLGERVDLIEHQVSHAVKDPNGRAYNRTAHLPARRDMMQRWADYLDNLRQSAPATP